MSDVGSPGLVIRAVFRVYKVLVSPVLHAISPAQCKFLPTCSEYAYTAVARHGIWRGGDACRAAGGAVPSVCRGRPGPGAT